jgi:hypothetical protein
MNKKAVHLHCSNSYRESGLVQRLSYADGKACLSVAKISKRMTFCMSDLLFASFKKIYLLLLIFFQKIE